MKRRLLVVSIAALTATVLAAMPAPGSELAASTGKISGTVTDAVTGELLQGAGVMAFDNVTWDLANWDVTGAAGTYLIEELDPGTYALKVYDDSCRDSYQDQWYEGAQGPLGATPVTVTAGQVTVGIDAAMVPIYFCRGEEATKHGTPGDDELFGTPGRDVIVGLDGNDLIVGRGGNDILCGNEGDDVLRGKAGRDVLDGGEGNDILAGGKRRDRLFGGPGDDTLRGNPGPDVLRGQRGADTLFGGLGEDMLFGGAGTDTLDGGPGTDVCSGELVTGCE